MLSRLLMCAVAVAPAIGTCFAEVPYSAPRPAAAQSALSPAEALLPLLASWLSANLDLPVVADHPRVEIASAARMAEVRYGRLASQQSDRVPAEAGRASPPELGQDVYAIYDDATRTIYLPEGWTAASPADVSLLVHELVHHVQNVSGLKYGCAQEREKLAYRAQARWLELFGRDLEEAFRIDPLTVLVRTTCWP